MIDTEVCSISRSLCTLGTNKSYYAVCWTYLTPTLTFWSCSYSILDAVIKKIVFLCLVCCVGFIVETEPLVSNHVPLDTIIPFQAMWPLHVPPSLTFKKFCILSTLLPSCVLYGSENSQRLFSYSAWTGLFLGAFTILRKATMRFVVLISLPVCLSASSVYSSTWKTRLPLDGFVRYLIFSYFFNLLRKFKLFKIWQE